MAAISTHAVLPELPREGKVTEREVLQNPLSESTSKHMLQAFERNDRVFDEDARYWWRTLRPFLKRLLTCLHYTPDGERNALYFTRDVVAPSLGPRPTSDGRPSQWKSFMTDDFTPIEFSWTWSDNDRSADRRIRFSIEAIGDAAGTVQDPWNTAASLSLLRNMGQFLRELELNWFLELSDLVVPSDASFQQHDDAAELSSLSSMFLAFEFGEMEPVIKAYLMPDAKAAVTGQTKEAVVQDVLTTFARRNQWQGLEDMMVALQGPGKALQLSPFMIAIDCVAAEKARLKVYLRSPDTSFAAVRQVMSMFDNSESTQRGLQELRQLWPLLFGLEDNWDETSPLPSKEHQTSGILYYAEVRPSSSKTTVKIYLPVKHYAKNDQQAAEGLTAFIRQRESGKEQMCNDFLHALKDVCDYRALDGATGLQTYVSCAIRNGTLDITSYLSPEVYNAGRVTTLE